MADFGAIQPRQFIMDSSRVNGATLGEFHQNNNRYLCTLELFDHSVPVSIPAGADIAIKCKAYNSNTVYVIDKNNPDFASKVSFTPGENKIMVDRWGAMVSISGQMLLGVDINGMSTYTVTYTVDKDLMNGDNTKFVQHSETPITDFAKADLSNVSKVSVIAKAKEAGLMQNDMEDVDLIKLGEKVANTDFGKEVDKLTKEVADYKSPNAFTERLKQDSAFIALSKGLHPSTSNLTPEQIKKMVYANRFEETAAVDLTKEPYSKAKILLLVFQLTQNNQTFTQVLPPLVNDQIILVKVLRSLNITGGKVVLQPNVNEMIDGAYASKEISEDGYNGMLLPLSNENTYEWFGHEKTASYALTVSDEKGNASLGIKSITFAKSTIEDDGDGNIKVISDEAELTFKDSELKKEFKSNKFQCSDGSIRIANLGGVADVSVIPAKSNEGIMAMLGYDRIFNSKYDNAKFWFEDIKYKGGMFVYANSQDKTFVIQEIDGKDPNVTGGTLFLLGLSYCPSKMDAGTITQDGFFRIEFADQNGDILYDIDGNPMATEIHYLAGQKERKQLYLGLIKAAAYTEIRPKFVTNFANEELLSIGAETAIVIQPLADNAASGLALLNFIAYTGYSVNVLKRYYGINNMNLAQDLIFDEPITELEPQTMYFGDNVWVSNKTKMRFGIQNYRLIAKDAGGLNLPVFCLYKRYNRFDTFVMRQAGASAKVTLKVINKMNAFRVALLKYTGAELDTIPAPELLNYNNGSPVFAKGWEVADGLFIAEDAVDDIHTVSKDFILPIDGKELAFVLYSEDSEQPLDLAIEDFEIDITPEFTRAIVMNNSHIEEEMLYTQKGFYKSIVACPSNVAAYRYTVNSSDTKIPVGVIKGLDSLVINNNVWHDAGSSDPMKVQGDLQFKADGKVNLEYGAQLFNETDTENTVDFWLAKVESNGSFTEVPGSRYTSKVDINRSIAKNIISNSFNFEVKENESYRVFAKSNIDDGFYLECTPNGSPLFYCSIVFDKLEPIDQRIIDLINAKK